MFEDKFLRVVKIYCQQQGLLSVSVKAQAAQALSMNHTSNTIGHRIIRVYMGFSTRYPWR